MKVSINDLRNLLEELNNLNVGKYQLYMAYGSYGLNEVINEHGGCRTIFSLTTKKELYNQMYAYIKGIYKEKEND